jgi:hypothetical protein
MKLRISVILTVLITVAIISAITLIMDRAPSFSPKAHDVPEAKKKDKEKNGDASAKHLSKEKIPDRGLFIDDEQKQPPEIAKDGEKEAAPPVELSEEDIKKIRRIASLSEAELAQEIKALRKRIVDEDLFGQLEEGSLQGEKKAEAKETLERFALLGLEPTRRKFMDKDPELKNPFLAYKDSLREIRELLNDEDESDDDDDDE